jgi:hypothetical protein
MMRRTRDLIVMGIHHLCLFLLRTEDPSTLWFASLVCFTALWQATLPQWVGHAFEEAQLGLRAAE